MLLACLIAAPLLAAGEPEGGAAAIGVSERVAFSQIQTLAAEATGTAAEVQRLLPPVTVVRKLLSLKDPPIDETIGSGVVPSLVRLLAPSFGFHLIHKFNPSRAFFKFYASGEGQFSKDEICHEVAKHYFLARNCVCETYVGVQRTYT